MTDIHSYVGILHEINPQDSTIALEEVFSLGTEGRKVENFIPPSNQRFEYIRFKGSDVKEINAIRDEDPAQRPSPQEVPQDPAIVVCQTPCYFMSIMMKYFYGCNHRPVLKAQTHVDSSVAFLLI